MIATCLTFPASSDMTSKVRGRVFLFNRSWWMSLSKRSLTHVKFCKPQHSVARKFKVTSMLYEETLLVLFVLNQVMIWYILVQCLHYTKTSIPYLTCLCNSWFSRAFFFIFPSPCTLILDLVVLWSCYCLVSLFLGNLLIYNFHWALQFMLYKEDFQQGNLLEFIANKDTKNSCSSLPWPYLTCMLLLYLSNLLVLLTLSQVSCLLQKIINYKFLMAISVFLGIWCVYILHPIFTFNCSRDVIGF